MNSIVQNIDCMLGMKEYPDKYFELAIVDPPYGIDIAKWDKAIPDSNYFDELFRVSQNQLIFGGNYFNLSITRGWIIWDKTTTQHKWMKDRDCDDAEMIWTSLQQKTTVLKFTDFGNTSGFDGNLKVDYFFKGKIHPTQKHILLYKWLLDKYAKQGDKILDTHLGSGSSRIACYDYGFDFTGFELDKDYFEAQEKRFKDHISQCNMFKQAL